MKKQTTHSKNRLEVFKLLLHQKQIKREKHYFDFLRNKLLAKLFSISLFILMLVLPSLVKAQTLDYSFVVLGCNRVNDVDSVGNPSTANVYQLNRVFAEVAAMSPLPKYLFFAGDLVLGYENDTVKLANQLTAWLALYQASPLYSTPCQLVAIEGNHETQDKAAGKHSFVAAERTYVRIMHDYIIGSNGPTITGLLPGTDSLTTDQSKLTYSFNFHNDHFVVINTDPVGRDGIASYHWIQNDISNARASGVRHVFVIGHKPAYTGHFKLTPDGLENNIPQRNYFWNTMETLQADAFFSAHVHASDTIQPHIGKSWQVIAGNGGSQVEALFANSPYGYFGYVVAKVYTNNQVHVENWGRDADQSNAHYQDATPSNPTTLRGSYDIGINPVIDHTPLTNTTSAGPFSVVATITDNVAVTAAQLNYKVNEILQTPLTPTSISGNLYTFTIPGQAVAGEIKYNIQAHDISNINFYSTGSATSFHSFTYGPTFNSVDLTQYVRIGRYNLPEPTRTVPPLNSLLCQEASAVTYNWDTQTLFAMGDGSTSIVQVSKTGELINSMTLAQGSSPQGTEFYDTEGLTYLGNGQFVLVEERDRQAVLFTYVPGTTLIRSATQTVKLGTTVGNIGLEGITRDPYSNGFVCVKEKQPEGVFQTGIDFVNLTATNGSPTTVNSIDLFNPALANLADFADVFSLSNLPALSGQPQESNLLILSQESGKIVNIDRAGVIANSLTIATDPGNPLSVLDQQHEGITMDNNGILYTVSENGGGDFDHPQLWVYSRSLVPNQAPTAIALINTVTSIQENTSTASAIKVADITLTDDGIGTNNLYVGGTDSAYFEIVGSSLFIKAGTVLDFETKSSYSITVNVDDSSLGSNPDAFVNYTLTIIDIVNETPSSPTIIISEVAPWSSGNSPVAADWFEVTNTGNTTVNIAGWKMDDNSNLFSSSVALNGVTNIGPGESVIFIETATPLTTIPNFKSVWFGANPPAGLQIGSYTGSGVGLGTGGDAVNLYDASGLLQANVSFGISPTGLFKTFDNSNGLNISLISQLSAVGVRGAFVATNDANEIGSPGTAGKLFISEVAPWSSGNSPIGVDWFEVTNGRGTAVDITGWKMDDNSGSFAASVALSGITSIAPGESVVFMETADLVGKTAAFKSLWFGANPPALPRFGNYTGAGVGLGTGGDAVNLYTSGGFLMCNVAFGVSPGSPFPTFDNAAGLNNATISQLSSVGVNGAFKATNDILEIGSPGTIINPEVSVGGNNVNINDGGTTVSTTNNTDFGSMTVGSTTSKTFDISNAGPGTLTVSGINFTGTNASEFNLVSAPTFPLNIVSGSTLTITVQFAPIASGVRNATLHIMNTDNDESDFDFAIQGTVECNEILISASTTDIQCHGELDGEIDLNVNGSVGPYSYLWNNGSTIQDLINLEAGSYSVNVTDLYGCFATASFSITQPTSVSLSNSVTNNNCNGNASGAIDLTVFGGTPGYTYLWNDFSTDEDRSGLAAGTYTVYVSDFNNCSQTLVATITQPAALNITVNGSNVSCNGGNNGSASVVASNGVGPYSYSWSNGSSGSAINNLSAGSYTVIVSDACNATLSANYTVTQPTVISISGTVIPGCKSSSNGAINITATGGTNPFTYLWNNGSTYEDRIGLNAGIFTVTVTDANNCSASTSFTLVKPAALLINTNHTNVRCGGKLTGSVTVNPVGGLAPYAYLWSNGITSATNSNLAAGTYTVFVTDAATCTKSTSVTITQNSPLIVTVAPSGNNAVASPAGGVPPYSYTWKTVPNQYTQTATGLTSGATYKVNVTDSKGCSVLGIITMPAPRMTSTAMVNSINVYPNPSTGLVTITGFNCNSCSMTISLTDVTGRMIYKSEESNIEKEIVKDFSNLPSGVYFIVVETSDKLNTIKLVKE